MLMYVELKGNGAIEISKLKDRIWWTEALRNKSGMRKQKKGS